MSAPGAPMTRRELREQEARGGDRPTVAPAVTPTAQVIVARRAPVRPKRKAASTLFSMGAMLFAGALFVGVSVPANAFMFEVASSAVATKALEGQTVEVSADALASSAARSTYTVTSYAETLRARYGNRNYSYSVGSGPVQWPFPYAVPIGDGFGERIAPCRGCSTNHRGTDFNPGDGAPIYSIAAGVVSYTVVSDYGTGNQVAIDHVINGQKVQSVYRHMQMNSSPLQPGDVVAVGDFVGLVGDTGATSGPHLHLEINLSGQPIDPFAWLVANAAK